METVSLSLTRCDNGARHNDDDDRRHLFMHFAGIIARVLKERCHLVGLGDADMDATLEVSVASDIEQYIYKTDSRIGLKLRCREIRA